MPAGPPCTCASFDSSSACRGRGARAPPRASAARRDAAASRCARQAHATSVILPSRATSRPRRTYSVLAGREEPSGGVTRNAGGDNGARTSTVNGRLPALIARQRASRTADIAHPLAAVLWTVVPLQWMNDRDQAIDRPAPNSVNRPAATRTTCFHGDLASNEAATGAIRLEFPHQRRERLPRLCESPRGLAVAPRHAARCVGADRQCTTTRAPEAVRESDACRRGSPQAERNPVKDRAACR